MWEAPPLASREILVGDSEHLALKFGRTSLSRTNGSSLLGKLLTYEN